MKCCICGKEFEGYGNNPWPVSQKVGDKCCDECNLNVVIPKRLEKIRELSRERHEKKKR